MSDIESSYDVAIIGGRPAGASLAARLGKAGLRVLIVDRAELPSLPTVPSSPVIYAAAMRLLDEIGIAEESYADPTAQVGRFVMEFGEYFRAGLDIPSSQGRSYARGLDRATFDHLLWRHLEKHPSVTARARFSFVDVVRDASGTVTGFVGQAEGGAEVRVSARCLVGADGRYSLVARKVGARVTEEKNEHTSTVYYADWEGVSPIDGEPPTAGHVFATGRGTDVLGLPVPGGRMSFNTHQRSDRVLVDGDAEAYYLGVLRSCPGIARRIAGAKRVSPVIGMKRIANRYLEHAGPGWALVGDALHHKDPVDGQGIYDALVESKVLAEALVDHLQGERTWDDAMAFYGRRVMEETHAMFLVTVDRLRRELYDEPPVLIIKTLLKTVMNDPEYQRRFLLLLARDFPAERWSLSDEIRRAALRGVSRKLRSLWPGAARRAAS